MSTPHIPHTEFADRRKKTLSALKGAIGVVHAGLGRGDLHDSFRPHPTFEYLTGVTDERGAVLVLDPRHPVASRRAILFLRPLNPEAEKWDGYRLEIGKALRDRTGLETLVRLDHLPRFLNEAARRSKALGCLHPLARHDQPVSPDLAIFRRIAERVPGVEIIDHTEVPAKLRSVKSRNEIAMIRRAIAITAGGFEAAMKAARPGVDEFGVQEALEHAYRTNGSRGAAFPSIVGSGVNSTVLHYQDNAKEIERGDLICIDSGAAFGGYGADITRTIPASGRFTDRQSEIYEIVLRAEMAAIRLVKAGAKIADLDRAARGVITKAGYGDFFIHGIGHHLGLETHDITPDGALQAGNVITVEPGIYLPDEKIGVRIEDDILVKKDGGENLSSAIPKRVKDIEAAMGR
jgi:Xaa-Pro aminopeptidase